jgi:hypothetical protein
MSSGTCIFAWVGALANCGDKVTTTNGGFATREAALERGETIHRPWTNKRKKPERHWRSGF